MAYELKKHLHELMGWSYQRVTDKQYRTWRYWLELQWNLPGRIEHYLMQIALHTDKLSMDPKKLKGKKLDLDSYRVKFEPRRKEPVNGKAQDKEYLSNVSLMTWVMRLGGPGKIRGIDKAIEHSKRVARERQRLKEQPPQG